jgi:hypothetical protein
METLVHERPDTTTRSLRHLPSFPQMTYPFGHPVDECPACHSEAMCWIANESLEYNYLCEACGRCWSLGSAGVTRVNPLSCSDCDHREACFEELRKELAACRWLPTGQ